MFADWPGIETSSAGLNHGAENPVTPELLQWADIIFVMERTHRTKLSTRFKPHLSGKRVVCLEIPDDYEFMEPALIRLLEAKVPRHLPSR
ncbi:low molecular weight protein tyrosine phosphatase family protein [Lysobacter tyrosinilyticus]